MSVCIFLVRYGRSHSFSETTNGRPALVPGQSLRPHITIKNPGHCSDLLTPNAGNLLTNSSSLAITLTYDCLQVVMNGKKNIGKDDEQTDCCW